MNKAALQSIDRCLRTIASAHLIEHGTDMNADRFFGNIEIFGNLAIAAAFGNAGQDLRLARRQFNGRHTLGKTIKRDMRKIAQSAIDILNCIQQLFSAGIFSEIGHRAAMDRAVDIFAALVIGKNNDAYGGKLLAELRNDIEATDSWKAEIEHDHIGPQRAVHRDAELPIAGFADDLNLCMAGEDRVQGHAGEEMVLDKKNSNLLHIPIHRIT